MELLSVFEAVWKRQMNLGASDFAETMSVFTAQLHFNFKTSFGFKVVTLFINNDFFIFIFFSNMEAKCEGSLKFFVFFNSTYNSLIATVESIFSG